MPHGSTSCRRSGASLLRTELERLYAQRAAVDAAIRDLELKQASRIASDAGRPPNNNLELRAKPCNLTSCRSA